MGFQYSADGSQAKDAGPRVLPEGDYEFRINEVPKHSITTTNRNMLTFKFTVDNGEFQGKTVRFNLVFIPKGESSHSMTVKALKAFGMEYDGILHIEPEDFLDRVVRAHVKLKPETFIPKGESKSVTVNKPEIGWFILPDDEVSQIDKRARDVDEVPF